MSLLKQVTLLKVLGERAFVYFSLTILMSSHEKLNLLVIGNEYAICN